MLETIRELARDLGVNHSSLPEVSIDNGVLDTIPEFLATKGFSDITIVVDQHTKRAAGKQLLDMLSEQFNLTCVELKSNKHGQVIADEQALVQLMVEMPNDTDVLLAVGSGTIHDIVRFIGYKMEIPFISVPTAASVDGFASRGAPIILRGFKQTIQTAAPIAIFADINIIKQAPREMTAAGFGDILGKYTSLTDWKISSIIGNEPYSELATKITRQSLESCVAHVEKIADGDDEGIKILMEALIDSGLVMLILNHSRPASGSEHHLSHYWEMELLKEDKEQLLHGAKVGVTTTIIAELYKQVTAGVTNSDIPTSSTFRSALAENWGEIKSLVEALPDPEYLRGLLKQVGGPTTPAELNISNELVETSLNEAYTLRDRCTGLLIINDMKTEPVTIN